jgi:2,3-dihydroxybenzoate decarboxylase
MKNKIALEEHFTSQKTTEDSHEYIYPDKWIGIKHHIQEFC